MKAEKYDDGLSTPATPAPRYLLLAVISWVLILLFVFNVLDDKVSIIKVASKDKSLSTTEIPSTPVLKANYVAHLNQVTLSRDHSGHYIYQGQINDEDVIFIIDTGATDVSIPGHIAERLNLGEGQPIHFQTANGLAKGFKTRLDTVTLGEVSLENVSASINPNVKVNYVLLGMSFLKNIRFVQADDTLTLSQ